MSDKVLSAFIADYISFQATPVVEFVWQGGEPTLLGLDFFRRVIGLQKPFKGQKTISISFQTNGTLLTDEWCLFLKKHDFMVGISLDGPREIHDRYRRDHKENGSFDKVMRGLNKMAEKSLQTGFGVAKETALPRWCRECDVLVAFQGGCPKHRFLKTVHDEPGLQYLCPGYRKFFLHIRNYLRTITKLLENGLPASYVMDAIKGPLAIKMETNSSLTGRIYRIPLPKRREN